jgi:hypothetical protein
LLEVIGLSFAEWQKERHGFRQRLASLINFNQHLNGYRDNLAGTAAAYGTYESGPMSSNSFSVPFSASLGPRATQEIMLMTGDKSTFLIMTMDQLANLSAIPQRVRALSSSIKPKPRTCLSFHSNTQNSCLLDDIFILNRAPWGPLFLSDPVISMDSVGVNPPIIYGL